MAAGAAGCGSSPAASGASAGVLDSSAAAGASSASSARRPPLSTGASRAAQARQLRLHFLGTAQGAARMVERGQHRGRYRIGLVVVVHVHVEPVQHVEVRIGEQFFQRQAPHVLADVRADEGGEIGVGCQLGGVDQRRCRLGRLALRDACTGRARPASARGGAAGRRRLASAASAPVALTRAQRRRNPSSGMPRSLPVLAAAARLGCVMLAQVVRRPRRRSRPAWSRRRPLRPNRTCACLRHS